MKFEITLRIGYAEQTFEFDTCGDAFRFAKSVLEHSVEREDGKKIEVVMISVKLDEPTEEEIREARELFGDD